MRVTAARWDAAGCAAAGARTEGRSRRFVLHGAGGSGVAGPEAAGRTQLRLWRPCRRSTLDLLCAEVAAHEIRPHVHEELQISLPLTPFWIVDGLARAEPIEPGSIGIIDPGELHGALSAGPARFAARVLLVAAETMARVWEAQPGRPEPGSPWFPRRIVTDRALAAELHRIFAELRRPPTALPCHARLIGCLAELIARHAEPSAPPGAASPRHRLGSSRVREYLRAHVADPVSTDELARVAGLNKYYLLRAFARTYGVSPHAYQMQLRLARARTLLARGVSASDAAHAAGFADQSHLTRRMRAAFGFTPAAYARQFDEPGRRSPARRAADRLARVSPPP